jgi:hypothetical protein
MHPSPLYLQSLPYASHTPTTVLPPSLHEYIPRYSGLQASLHSSKTHATPLPFPSRSFEACGVVEAMRLVAYALQATIALHVDILI